MGIRETRLRRAVVSGIKLGISSAAVLATAAGWALFGATDQTGASAQAEPVAMIDQAPQQAPQQVEPQNLFSRRGRDEHGDRGQFQPQFGFGDDEHARPPQFGSGDDEEFEHDRESGGDEEQGGSLQPVLPPETQPVTPPSSGSQSVQPVTPSQPGTSAPRRPVTRTRSSR